MDSRAGRSFNDIQLKHIGRIFGHMVRVRAWLGPVLAAIVLSLVVADGKPWRLVWGGVQIVVSFSFFLSELRRYNREGLTARSVPVNVCAALLFVFSLVVATGGLASPLLVMIIPLSFSGALVFPRAHHWQLVVAELGMLALLAAAQLAGWLPGLPLSFLGTPSPVMLACVGGMLFLMLILVNVGGGAVRRTFDDMLAEALSQRDELLATHRTYARAMESMSAEIAHELKNPLATVKGLTQLMVREAGRAQPSERLEVLSSEVVRMQGILEEFLNFSRPLVPLSLSAVDLAALCDETLVLHEGLASQKGVRLERQGTGPVHAACDPRKVKQVMMNLLHNAIEASPRGGCVTLEVGATPGGNARVAVRDQGPGLAPDVEARAFEPGVTTKATGSGLGLTVARALARQHGGEVTLENGAGGGCVAELVLPRELPAAHPEPLREAVARG